MEVWKIMFLSKWVICRFHVNLPGCTVVILDYSNLFSYNSCDMCMVLAFHTLHWMLHKNGKLEEQIR